MKLPIPFLSILFNSLEIARFEENLLHQRRTLLQRQKASASTQGGPGIVSKEMLI